MESVEKEKRPLILNGEKTEYTIFQCGDRVECSGDKGTVESTFNHELFVNVKWDEGVNRGTIYIAIDLRLLPLENGCCGEYSCK